MGWACAVQARACALYASGGIAATVAVRHRHIPYVWPLVVASARSAPNCQNLRFPCKNPRAHTALRCTEAHARLSPPWLLQHYSSACAGGCRACHLPGRCCIHGNCWATVLAWTGVLVVVQRALCLGPASHTHTHTHRSSSDSLAVPHPCPISLQAHGHASSQPRGSAGGQSAGATTRRRMAIGSTLQIHLHPPSWSEHLAPPPRPAPPLYRWWWCLPAARTAL